MFGYVLSRRQLPVSWFHVLGTRDSTNISSFFHLTSGGHVQATESPWPRSTSCEGMLRKQSPPASSFKVHFRPFRPIRHSSPCSNWSRRAQLFPYVGFLLPSNRCSMLYVALTLPMRPAPSCQEAAPTGLQPLTPTRSPPCQPGRLLNAHVNSRNRMGNCDLRP